MYFEANGTQLSMVVRKSITGSVDSTSEKITQANWNGDRLDGTGASGKTLDPNKRCDGSHGLTPQEYEAMKLRIQKRKRKRKD